MKTKENKNSYKMYIIASITIILLIIIIFKLFTNSYTEAKETSSEEKNAKISDAKPIDLNKIIEKNSKQSYEEKIETREEVLEFLTKYTTNPDLPKGTIHVIQEGREGLQKISTKKVYKEGNLISEQQVGAVVTKASVDKIIEIGDAKYTDNHSVKTGDIVYSTANRTYIMQEPDINSVKQATLGQNQELKVLEETNGWYKISSSSATGWIKKESTTYVNPNKPSEEKTNGQIMQKLDFNMKLNEPSGLTLEQFKKVLTDSKDVNKIFQDNAEYFYYIEKQYNINGIFVAAIGIHESAWGTSQIARDKTNLFGYGAYDSNPYNGAYTFSSYAESIDLMARVLTKYYLNPAGTSIYDGEKAAATYYNGPTVSGVNKRYATDKNWGNAVYSYIKYLYEKI